MARPTKKASKADAPTQAAASAPPTTGTDQVGDRIKVALYDAGGLKNTLDDVAKTVIMDAGYDEDLMISNVKIALGLLAIAVALYAQLGPGKFPATWWTVAACVVAYTLLTVVLNLYSWLREGDAFLVTKPRRSRDAGLRLASHMDRFADEYVLVISSNKEVSIEARLITSVTKFFHEDGYMAEEAFRSVVERLLSQYETTVSSALQKKAQ